ncbi:hypothetical protein JET14_09275 [Martelella lutilitoris]|uniref:Uncharacterized protein n=1 Tax=Martelella lutilitoris TaxID=2583532 RepID=A0A7T7KN84_9HYPH|nr:hypothetical protein [Martelella lutilitoris]QQM32298.1 hypothetical protein JET14_09275 [Martelella lutilitoris]
MTHILAIGGIVLCLLLFLSAVLAFFRLWTWSAGIVALPALPLQLLGFTGTCTQGADGPFVTGAVLSSPFLAGAICLVLWGMAKGVVSPSGAIVTLAVAAVMLFLTRQAWLGAVFSGTPCGAGYGARHWQGQVLVLGGYLVLPAILLVCSCRAALLGARGKGSRRVGTNGTNCPE